MVAAHCRRRGIGSQILRALIDNARRLGFKYLVLETSVTWDSAVLFYERNGFMPTTKRDGDQYFERMIATD